MNLIPNTVCRRCHREYPSIRSRCPYCGTKKPREVKRSMPESDSAVRGTEAARQAAENMNWQMLIGGVLLICVIAAVIAIVSVNLKAKVDATETAAKADAQAAQIAAETTAVPAPTPTPTPSPTPKPAITSISITYGGRDMSEGFMEPAGSQIDLDAQVYPLTEDAEITWTSSHESVAVVDDEGVVTVVGSGGSCVITATAGAVSATCPVWAR